MASLALAQANELIATALAQARRAGLVPMAIVVLDAAGQMLSAQREDGASALRIEIAIGKAAAAIGMGASSRVLAQRAKDMPVFFTALAAAAHGRFLAQTGAVLVKDAQGRVLGAAGASGGSGDEDEAICIAGVQAAGLTHG